MARVRALWLSGNRAAAQCLIVESLPSPINSAVELDLRWIALCLDCTESGDLKPIALSLKNGSQFYSANYVTEGLLWLRACTDRDLADTLPKCENLIRNRNLDISGSIPELKFLQELERSHDQIIPMNVRLTRIGKILTRSEQLRSVEHALLFLAAAARWLLRSRAHEFAYVVIERYKSISLTLSCGANANALGILSKEAISRLGSHAA